MKYTMDRKELIENTKLMLESHDEEIVNLALNVLYPTEINFKLKFNIEKNWNSNRNKVYAKVGLTVLDFETETVLYNITYNDFNTYYEECEQQCLNLLFIKLSNYFNYNKEDHYIDPAILNASKRTKMVIDVINAIYRNHTPVIGLNINISANILINKMFKAKLLNNTIL